MIKVGDIVRMAGGFSEIQVKEDGTVVDESKWRGIVVRWAGDCYEPEGNEDDEWEIHWLHNPPSETSFEYGYYLEVLSESR